mgnify:CR=1 FL=1
MNSTIELSLNRTTDIGCIMSRIMMKQERTYIFTNSYVCSKTVSVVHGYISWHSSPLHFDFRNIQPFVTRLELFCYACQTVCLCIMAWLILWRLHIKFKLIYYTFRENKSIDQIPEHEDKRHGCINIDKAIRLKQRFIIYYTSYLKENVLLMSNSVVSI